MTARVCRACSTNVGRATVCRRRSNLDPDIYQFDLRAIFYPAWNMVGFEAELDQPGAYIATVIGPSPILVLRTRQGDIRAFHNSCRHRGAQICKTGSGRTSRLVCPYHQWSYSLDGKLASARGAGADLMRTRTI